MWEPAALTDARSRSHVASSTSRRIGHGDVGTEPLDQALPAIAPGWTAQLRSRS